MFVWNCDKAVFVLGVSSRQKGDKVYHNLSYFEGGYTHNIPCSQEVFDTCTKQGIEKCDCDISGEVIFYSKGVLINCTHLEKVEL